MKDWGIWEKIPPQINMCRGAFQVSSKGVSEPLIPTKGKNVELQLKKEEVASIILRGLAKYSWFLPSTPNVAEIEVVGTSRKRKL